MKTLSLFTLATVISLNLHAQSLTMREFDGNGIYCRFSPDCHVNATEETGTTSTNGVKCVLNSRSFPAALTVEPQPYGGPQYNSYGYEYRLTVGPGKIDADDTNATVNVWTVQSLSLNFSAPETFAYGLRASNQVWVLTNDVTGKFAPSSVNFAGTNIVVRFSPPVVLDTRKGGEITSFAFGLISANKPRSTTAIVSGSAAMSDTNTLPFSVEVNARTP